MSEYSWFWGGVGTGDAGLGSGQGAPYSDVLYSKVMSYLNQYSHAINCVIPSAWAGLTGNLAGSYSGTTITIQTGIALVDGTVYVSDAAENHSVGADGTYSVVLRKSGTGQTNAQTVRQELILTSALTQTQGTIWEVEIYRVVRSGGTITEEYDLRRWAKNDGLLKYVDIFPYKQTFSELSVTAFGQDFEGNYVSIPQDYNSDLSIECFLTCSGGIAGNMNYTLIANLIPRFEDGYQEILLTYVVDGTTPIAADAHGFGVPAGRFTLYTTSTDSAGHLACLKYRGGMITFGLSRDPLDVTDTLDSEVQVLGMRMSYR